MYMYNRILSISKEGQGKAKGAGQMPGKNPDQVMLLIVYFSVVSRSVSECVLCKIPAAMAGHHLAIGCNTMVDGHLPHHMGYAPFSCRSPSEAPLRKLTVDLIKTYRKINEVWIV